MPDDPPLSRKPESLNHERPPICPACGVTMAPAALSAQDPHNSDWVCLECEETTEPDDV